MNSHYLTRLRNKIVSCQPLTGAERWSADGIALFGCSPMRTV